MNRKFLSGFIILLHLSSFITANQTFAQMPFRNQNQVAVLKWTDDTHYLISTFDSDKKTL